MSYRLLANAVVVFHFAVVIFVVCGGLLVLRWRRVAWAHLPIAGWVIFAEWFHRMCPLTFLENWLRERAGTDAYRGDFVSHYVIPVLYPEGLTDRMQMVLGTFIFVTNVVLYAVAFHHRRRPDSGVDVVPSPGHSGTSY